MAYLSCLLLAEAWWPPNSLSNSPPLDRPRRRAHARALVPALALPARAAGTTIQALPLVGRVGWGRTTTLLGRGRPLQPPPQGGRLARAPWCQAARPCAE